MDEGLGAGVEHHEEVLVAADRVERVAQVLERFDGRGGEQEVGLGGEGAEVAPAVVPGMAAGQLIDLDGDVLAPSSASRSVRAVSALDFPAPGAPVMMIARMRLSQNHVCGQEGA